MQASLASSTKAQYERAWSKLVGFFQSLGTFPMLPISVAMMMVFIAYMHNKGYAPSSMISTVSAISYFRTLNGFPDPAKNCIISKLLTGTQLISALPDVITLHYKCVMLRAMMVLAFRAYLRVGEMVPRSRRLGQGCLLSETWH